MANSQIIYQDCEDLQKAKSSWIAMDYPHSLRLYEKAVKRNPSNAMVLQEAGSAFAQRYQLEKSHACISRLLRLGNGNDTRILHLAAQLWLRSYRPERAKACLVKATQLNNPSADTHIELTNLYERAGQTAKALEQVEKAISLEPANGLTLWLKGNLLTRIGETEAAEKIFSKLSISNHHSPLDQAHGLNGWAHLLDREAQYDQAIEKLQASKAILEAQTESRDARSRSHLEYERLSYAVNSLNQEHISSWSEQQPPQKARNVLLTGNPRSGTTLIEKILDAHSKIITADEYNVLTSYIFPDLLKGCLDANGHFDSNGFSSMSRPTRQRAASNYVKSLEAVMDEKIRSRYIIDKNPGLTGHIPALFNILPESRVLFAVRNPLDIALSCYFRWLPINSASVNYLNLGDSCTRTAQEFKFWTKLRGILPPTQWHETRYEDTIHNPHHEAGKILTWLGLEWEDGIHNYRDQLQERGVNSPTYEAVSKPIYKGAINRWKNYEQHFEKLIATLEGSLNDFQYS